MRVRSLVLVVALFAAGCDKGSKAGGQGNASAPAANGQSPDEAAPGPSANALGAQAGFIDAHKGTPAPAVAFTDPDGKQVTLASYRGKPLLLNLWATWCGPCVKELPTLAILVKTNGKVRVVTLDQGEDAAKVKAFLAQHRLAGVPAYTDPTGHWLGTETESLPTTILYDANGKEVWRLAGPYDWTSPAAAKAVDRAG